MNEVTKTSGSKRRRRLLAILATVAVIAVGAFGGAFTTGGSKPPVQDYASWSS